MRLFNKRSKEEAENILTGILENGRNRIYQIDVFRWHDNSNGYKKEPTTQTGSSRLRIDTSKHED